MGNDTNVNIGNSGEYFVAGELERRGYTVAVPMSNVYLDFVADNLGQEIIKDKAQQIYEGLSDECKEQVIQYQNGARNKSWMLNRCNLKYIVDNNLFH